MSPLTQGRGLKLLLELSNLKKVTVAPHAGAWIETQNEQTPVIHVGVAPHAGAWIETCKCSKYCWTTNVAPHAGAWIETRI